MKRPQISLAVVMGVSIGVLANSRPYEGFVLSVALFAVLLWWMIKQQPSQRMFAVKAVAMPIAAILLCTAGLMAYYNLRVTGSALLLPHALYQRAYDPTPIFLWQEARPAPQYNNIQLAHFFTSGMAGQFYHRSWQGVEGTLMKKVNAYRSVFFWPGALPLLLFLPYVFRDRRIRLLVFIWIPCLIGLAMVVWSFTHYAAPILCIFYAAVVQSLRHMRAVKMNHRRIGMTLARVVIVLLLIDTGSEIYTFSKVPEVMGWLGGAGINERADIIADLNKTPGKHLVFVRYDPLHNLNFEWVFNGADIDGAKVVWAREVNPEQDAKLRAYFHDRQIWVIEPDVNAAKLLPYTPPKSTRASR
jgi:hypothetical protein